MNIKIKILGINGSASSNSSNLTLLKKIKEYSKSDYDITIIDNLADFPHFRTELTINNVPDKIINLRNQIEKSDGVIICSPEYVFSIPSGLKNIIEWCVSTVIFSDKPTGLITASASGEKGHEELQLIMKTVMANFIPETTLLIQGIKGKVNSEGEIIDKKTEKYIVEFVNAFNMLLNSNTTI